ncbi:zf-TFIIB domain-containing protein [Spongorhabdus nitratireducens]
MELDYCQKCEGIFFDKGELEALSPDFKAMDGVEVASDALKALAVIVVVTKAVTSWFSFLNDD